MPTKKGKAGPAARKTVAKKAAPKKPAAKRPAAPRPPAARGSARPRARGPAVAARTEGQSPDNVAVECVANDDGSVVVVVAYEGPLAAREQVTARAGARRAGGGPWADAIDVDLDPDGEGRWVGMLKLPAGERVEALELVFRAGDEWDNGGLAPLGYYEWSVADGRLDAR